jgi:hypothetical protein
MEVSDMTVLEAELVDIKARLARLEAAVSQLPFQPSQRSRNAARRKRAAEPTSVVNQPLSSEDLLAQLRADGVITDPPPMVKEAAARWEALSPEEKAAVRDALDNLPPGPMASDIIIENRR